MSGRDGREGGENGLIWRLPQVKSKQLGKLGPGFGIGGGCGVGFGLGLLGGAGIGPGIPGLQLGFGLGVGCGVGLGFGYGLGKGVAHDERRRYSNVGSLFHSPADYPTRDDIGALVDNFIRNTKKIIEVTSREIDKWGR